MRQYRRRTQQRAEGIDFRSRCRSRCRTTAWSPTSATGAWAYRPTATARHYAVADHATNADQHDTFAVTVSDNDGGTTDIPVTVSLTTMMTVPSYAVTAQIPVGVTPVGVAISPRRDYVYVTSFVDHAAVTVLRTDDATTTTIPLTFRPEGIVVGADGRHLYVADPTGNRVAVIDTTDRSTVFVPVGNKAAGSPPTRCRSSTRPAEWSSRPFPLEATRSRSVKAE